MRSRRRPVGTAPKPAGRGHRLTTERPSSRCTSWPWWLGCRSHPLRSLGPPARPRRTSRAARRTVGAEGRPARRVGGTGSWRRRRRDGTSSIGRAGVLVETVLLRPTGWRRRWSSVARATASMVISPGNGTEAGALDELADFGKVVALVASNGYHWLGQPIVAQALSAACGASRRRRASSASPRRCRTPTSSRSRRSVRCSAIERRSSTRPDSGSVTRSRRFAERTRRTGIRPTCSRTCRSCLRASSAP